MTLLTKTSLMVGGQPLGPADVVAHELPASAAHPVTVVVDVSVPHGAYAAVRPRTRKQRNASLAALPPAPPPPLTVRCEVSLVAPPAPESAQVKAALAAPPTYGASAGRAEPEPELPVRNRLGLINQRIKPVLGNVARRGMRYGIVVGVIAATTVGVAAPIVGPFCAVAAAALSAAVPFMLLTCALVGAIVEWTARRRRVRDVSVADVRELEAIYTSLQQQRQRDGKVPLADREAWHKVNAMLEEMSGGFWRGGRLILATHFGMRMHCGRYQVGSIFPETAEAKAG